MAQSTPDVMQAVKQEAKQYLGDVSSLSDDQIKSKFRNLAKSQPDTARRIVESVCSTLDRSSGGQFSGQIDRLEQIVFSKLGLEPGSLSVADQAGARGSNQPGAAAKSRQGAAAAANQSGASSFGAQPGAAGQSSNPRNRGPQSAADESWNK